MQIPEKFQLFGHEIQVVRNKKKLEWADAHGMWDVETNTIYLPPKKITDKWSDSFLFSVFTHELTHAILETVGRADLSGDEKLVDLIGQALAHVFPQL